MKIPSHLSVNLEHVELYGAKEALIIAHLRFWIKLNKEKRIHLHNGLTYSYQSVAYMQSLLPCLTQAEIRNALAKLSKGKPRRSKGAPEFEPVLVIGHFSDYKLDKTNWYAFKDEARFLSNASGQMTNSINNMTNSQTQDYPRMSSSDDSISHKNSRVSQVTNRFGQLTKAITEDKTTELYNTSLYIPKSYTSNGRDTLKCLSLLSLSNNNSNNSSISSNARIALRADPRGRVTDTPVESPPEVIRLDTLDQSLDIDPSSNRAFLSQCKAPESLIDRVADLYPLWLIKEVLWEQMAKHRASPIPRGEGDRLFVENLESRYDACVNARHRG